MRIRHKILLIVFVTLAVMLAGLYLLARHQLMGGFLALETRDVRSNVVRLLRTLDESVEPLELVVGDWGPWNDTYEFMASRDPAFIEENLSDDTLANLRVNCMLFYDTAGQLIHGKAIDLSTKQEVPVPDSLLAALETHGCLRQFSEPRHIRHGLLMVDHEPMTVATHAILKSDASGPAHGTLVVGRFLNAGERDRLAKLAQQPFTFTPLNRGPLPADVAAAHRRMLAGEDVVAQALDAQRIAGYGKVDDVCGGPLFLVRAEMPRDTFSQGQRSIAFLMLAMVTVGTGMALTVLLLLERGVVAPLSGLSVQVAKLGADDRPAERWPDKRRDEIGVLARAIGEMHSRLRDLTTTLQRDIERHQCTEASLRESQLQYRLVTDHIQDVIWVMDLNTMRMTFVTSSVMQLVGYTPQEMQHLTLEQILTEESLALASRELVTVLDDLHHKRPVDPPRRVMELEQRCKDGRHIWVEIHVSLLPAEREGDYRVIGVSRDVTERRRAAQDRERLEEHLRQSQKLEAVGTLAGGIAHDFNNILAAIIGHSELALAEYSDHPRLAKRLQRVLEASGRARELVEQILTFSRSQPTEKAPLRLDLVVKEALRLLRAVIPSSIDIQAELDPHSGMVLANATQIHQVVMNLCTNAQHAMSGGPGTLSVRLRSMAWESLDPSLRAELRAGGYVALSITDTGCGMEEATRRRIFEPFFTTKGPGRGTGMGLSVVRGIVLGHGGAIRVESQPGRGSTFHLYLPQAGAEEAGDPGKVEALAPPQGKGHILLVDDEEMLADLESEMLAVLGYSCEAYTDPLEALEAFRQRPEKFDLVMTDLTMPHMTGELLAGELLRLRPAVPIILCSGFSESLGTDRLKTIGFRTLLQKPLVLNEIAVAVCAALADSGSQEC